MSKDMVSHNAQQENTKHATIAGPPTHSHSQCYEGTLITYKFDSMKKYESYCYPRGYQGEKENEEYGNITNEHQLWDYHLTFKPEFYTARAKGDYYGETYQNKKQ